MDEIGTERKLSPGALERCSFHKYRTNGFLKMQRIVETNKKELAVILNESYPLVKGYRITSVMLNYSVVEGAKKN